MILNSTKGTENPFEVYWFNWNRDSFLITVSATECKKSMGNLKPKPLKGPASSYCIYTIARWPPPQFACQQNEHKKELNSQAGCASKPDCVTTGTMYEEKPTSGALWWSPAFTLSDVGAIFNQSSQHGWPATCSGTCSRVYKCKIQGGPGHPDTPTGSNCDIRHATVPLINIEQPSSIMQSPHPCNSSSSTCKNTGMYWQTLKREDKRRFIIKRRPIWNGIVHTRSKEIRWGKHGLLASLGI